MMNFLKKIKVWWLAVFVGSLVTLQIAGLPSAQIAPELQLKTTADKVVASEQYVQRNKDGSLVASVKYAYNSGIAVSNQVGALVTKEAQKKHLNIMGEDVSKRTDHAKIFKTDKPNQFVAEIIAGDPQYYQDEIGNWWIADYATTSLDAFQKQTGKLPITSFFGRTAHATTGTFYPGTYVDGGASYDAALSEDWATTRSANPGNGASPTAAQSFILAKQRVNTRYAIYRYMALFDTSSIGSTATLTSATFSLFIETAECTDSPTFAIVAAAPASNTDITTTDYATAYTLNSPTEYATRKTCSGITTGAYNDWTISNLAIISKTAITKIGVREGKFDIDNTSSFTLGDLNTILVDNSETAGTSSDPKLVVVYTGGGTASNRAQIIEE